MPAAFIHSNRSMAISFVPAATTRLVAAKGRRKMNKVGIYAGSFDPIHLGHITFALQAIEAGNLDKVYFLPERQPTAKVGLEHFGHRVAMINQAVKPHNQLGVIELEDKKFTVNKTMARLNKRLPNQQLVFLFGSDKVPDITTWPNSDRLFKAADFIIGLRKGDTEQQIKVLTANWPKPPLKIISSYSPKIVSTEIRDSLRNGRSAKGLLKSVAAYVKQHWLYISVRGH